MTHEYYVNFETAKLLKESMFDWECYELYEREYEQDGRIHSVTSANWNSSLKYYSAPTLDVVQRWLREVKHIEICISWEIEFEEKELDWNERRYCYDIDTHVDNIPLLSMDDDYWAEGYHTFGDSYSTYEEAQEAGIKKALELILEKVE